MSAPAVPPGYGAREAQPLDTIMARLDDVLGQIDLGNITRESPKPSAEDEAVAAAAARLAGTADFRLLLEWLADKTVRRPSALGAELDPARGWAMAQRREGANDILFLLMALIAHGRGQSIPAREGA